MSKNERQKLLERIRDMRVSIPKDKQLSTGSILADKILEGGLPVGSGIEIFGPPGYGKSTLCSLIIKANIGEALKAKRRIAWIDLERSVSGAYLVKLGLPFEEDERGKYRCTMQVDGEELIEFYQPDNAEGAANIMLALLESKQYLIIVIDSIGAMVPSNMMEQELDKVSQVGQQAKLMTLISHQTRPLLSASGTLLLMVNQVRDVISGDKYGPKFITPGGRAFHHMIDLSLEMFKPIDLYEVMEKRQGYQGIQLRFYIRKTRICVMNGALQNMVVRYDADTARFVVDVFSEIFAVAKMVGAFCDKNGAVWEPKSGNCYIDPKLIEVPDLEIDEKTGFYLMGRGEEKIREKIASDLTLFRGLRDFVEDQMKKGALDVSGEAEGDSN